jgi:hypothetical protein
LANRWLTVTQLAKSAVAAPESMASIASAKPSRILSAKDLANSPLYAAIAAAAFSATASRGAPRSPLKIARETPALNCASPPTKSVIGAFEIPKSDGSIRSDEISPCPIVRTEVVVLS